MERTIERLILDKEMLEGEIDDLVKEIGNLNIVIANKTYEVRKSKKELNQLRRAYKTIENLSNKIVGLAVALSPLEKRIMELEETFRIEIRNKEILEELRQDNIILKNDKRKDLIDIRSCVQSLIKMKKESEHRPKLSDSLEQ
ncbi:MAG: hypothetical protein N4A68_11865 [Maledivibacter sp.]|jgi:predicted  nucleic acid-binding Zn-ribbon protein|nr:hypothetical protein [Maledivibacter sp.]